MAMSRDIERYFVFDETSCIQTGENTILTEVRSKRKTPCFPMDHLFHRIVFTAYMPYMYLYEEKRQRKYHFQHDFTLAELGLTAKMLVQETVQYFTRGHSVRNRLCTCNPRLSYKRYMDYGLCSQHAHAHASVLDSSVLDSGRAVCPQDSQSQCQFTPEQVCSELGLRSLTSIVVAEKTVHVILRQSGEFLVHTDAAGAETWELCGKQTVDDEASLLRYVKKNRLGVATNDRKIDYPLMGADVRRLVKKQALVHLPAHGMLYAVPGMAQQRKCDDDIIALWKKCA